MIYVALILMCIVFVELFILMKLRNHIGSIMDLSKKVLHVLRSGTLSDDEKEIFMRRQSFKIMKETTIFTVKFMSIFLILYLLYLVASNLFSIPAEAFVESMFSLPVLLALTVSGIFYGWVRNAIGKRI